jgi:helix-turn-helix protein
MFSADEYLSALESSHEWDGNDSNHKNISERDVDDSNSEPDFCAPSSENHFERLYERLQECKDWHFNAITEPDILQEVELPTRLLDLTDVDHSRVSLHIPQDGARGNYVALSYC